MKVTYLETITVSDAWYQTLYKCIETGREFIIDRGSYTGQKRLEFDYIIIRIKYPYILPLLTEIASRYNILNPVDENHLYEGKAMTDHILNI